MNNQLKVGDKVMVLDKGLLMLQQFAPKGANPNNYGIVSEIMDDGMILVNFPIGEDNPDEHSQAAPYHKSLVKKL